MKNKLLSHQPLTYHLIRTCWISKHDTFPRRIILEIIDVFCDGYSTLVTLYVVTNNYCIVEQTTVRRAAEITRQSARECSIQLSRMLFNG